MWSAIARFTDAVAKRIPSKAERSELPTAAERLRALAGVDETLLSSVPHERPRYTALGGSVLATAILSALAMAIALASILDGFSAIALILVPLWGLFILNLDRWLVTSSLGRSWRSKTSVFLPRLLLAVVLGVGIAEALILGIFATAIEQHVVEGRSQDVRDLSTRLQQCNPVPGTPVAAGLDCSGAVLSLGGGTPQADLEQLDRLTVERDGLRIIVDSDTAELQRRENLRYEECAGGSGAGLTGVRGEGIECESRTADVNSWRETHPIEANSERLTALSEDIAQLTAALGVSQADYRTRLNVAITDEVNDLALSQREIGLLERLRGLDELVKENAYVNVAQWYLRVLLVVIDCIPILIKILLGDSAYDRLVSERVEFGEWKEGKKTRQETRRLRGDEEVDSREQVRRVEHQISEIDRRYNLLEYRADESADADVDREIDEAADRLYAMRQVGQGGASSSASRNGVSKRTMESAGVDAEV